MHSLLSIIFALFQLWPFPGPGVAPLSAFSVTDTFTYSGPSESLTTYSANWTYEGGNGDNFEIGATANHVGPNQSISGAGLARWNAHAFNDNQYSEVTVGSLSSNQYMGPAVRIATGTGTAYFISFDGSGSIGIYKLVSGAQTTLSSTTATLSAGDVIRLEVSGTTLTAKQNGSVLSALTATDSAIASGEAGIEGFGTNLTTITKWTGGNL